MCILGMAVFAAIAFFSVEVRASTEIVDGIAWIYSLSSKGAVIGAGSWYVSAIDNETKGHLVVPSALGGHPVVAIGDGAFYKCAKLTEVTLPASIAELGTQAFYHCDNLSKLIFLGDEPRVGYTCFGYSPKVEFYRSGGAIWPLKVPGDWKNQSVRTVKGLSSVSEIIEIQMQDGKSSFVAIPHCWLDRFSDMLESAGCDYSVVVAKGGVNGYILSDSYVAGLDPTDPNSKFTAKVEMADGKPVVSWSPNRSDRVYRVLGSGDLKTWREVGSGEEGAFRFFRVSVEMP